MTRNDLTSISFPVDVSRPRVEHRESSGTYRAEFDVDGRPVSDTVLAVVGVADEVDPVDLPPLYSVVDPDALDALFSSTSGGRSGFDGSVTFQYAGFEVTVRDTGSVEAERRDDSTTR